MSIDRLDPWGELGSLESDATFDLKITNGFVDERVPYPTFNKIENRQDEKINEMLDKGPRRGMPGTSFTDVVTGIYLGETSPLGTASTVDTLKATAEYHSYAVALIGGSRKIIACDKDAPLSVDIIDIDTMAFESAQSLPVASLPDIDTEQWGPVAITCDEDNAYIIFLQTNVTATAYSDYRVQAYSLADWSALLGWPSTGYLLFNTGGTFLYPDVINADASTIAIGNVSGSGDAVFIIDKAAGTLTASGNGDGATGATRICSNGTYIFTNSGYSISIANPATGCGGTNWPRSVPNARDVACIGGLVVYTCSVTNIAYISHVDNALVGVVTSADASRCEKLSRITSDGLYFYAAGVREVNGVDRYGLFRIDPYVAMQQTSALPENLGASIVTPIGLIDTATYSPEATSETPPVVFDGESIWLVQEKQDNCVLIRTSRVNLR